MWDDSKSTCSLPTVTRKSAKMKCDLLLSATYPFGCPGSKLLSYLRRISYFINQSGKQNCPNFKGCQRLIFPAPFATKRKHKTYLLSNRGTCQSTDLEWVTGNIQGQWGWQFRMVHWCSMGTAKIVSSADWFSGKICFGVSSFPLFLPILPTCLSILPGNSANVVLTSSFSA